MRRARRAIVVCNADEGEPGNFKDRVLLATVPDAVVEGMTIGAFATGARRGFMYLRGEYRFLLDRLEAVLARRRAAGLLGESILGREGFDFDVAIHVGAGAYVCGEESALIESLEGKRGTPRNRPPYPVTKGYLGEPTVVNNVETFASSCLVALRGRRVVRGRRHAGLVRHEARVRLRRLRPAGHLRVPVRRRGPAGARGLRRARHAGRPGERPVGRLHRRLRVRPEDRVRGPADRGRADGVRREPRHVRGGAQLRALLRARELRVLHAVPRRHVAPEEHDGQARQRPRLALRLRRDRGDEPAACSR